MIVIVDYGMGNLRSIQNMLKHVGAEVVISSDPDKIAGANKLILPGVGAFDNAVENIDRRGMREVLKDKVLRDKTPILGICLGMQLLAGGSEEGSLSGLGFIDGDSVRFRNDNGEEKLRVPHMGWNAVTVTKDSKLFEGMFDETRFYFVHSYHLECHNDTDRLCATDYGHEFVSAVAKDNVIGVQFHPESILTEYGHRIIENFLERKASASFHGYG